MGARKDELIAAGDLNQQIVIQTKVVKVDAAGVMIPDSRGHPQRSYPDLTGDPSDGTLVRCRIETLTGRKLEVARQLVPTATHQVMMRYRELNEENNRLVYKTGRIFNIGWINNVDERSVRLELTCTEQKTGRT